MQIIRKKSEMKDLRGIWAREGRVVGFVPTMGALHKGHITLVERSVAECDRTVVSIFVNPLQFGPKEDFGKYPRREKADCEMCEKAGADVVFIPTVEEMYPRGSGTVVEPHPALVSGMCGAKRPGHFRGVLTVVAKLFNIVQPNVAYFGQKDYQQCCVIEQMVLDLDFPVKLVFVPTVREPDGLAMSSRNEYLSKEERKKSVCLYKALKEAERMIVNEKEKEVSKIVERMKEIVQEAGGRIDYIEIVEPKSLRKVESIEESVVIGIAVFIGSTRLIDNIIVCPNRGEIFCDAL
ncbi:MAG: pantoate--beta-alanine ligase [Planctomycetota bacterium]|nr:pantoate--beta-alanine ligase [Planctomycetota bacterium]